MGWGLLLSQIHSVPGCSNSYPFTFVLSQLSSSFPLPAEVFVSHFLASPSTALICFFTKQLLCSSKCGRELWGRQGWWHWFKVSLVLVDGRDGLRSWQFTAGLETRVQLEHNWGENDEWPRKTSPSGHDCLPPHKWQSRFHKTLAPPQWREIE